MDEKIDRAMAWWGKNVPNIPIVRELTKQFMAGQLQAADFYRAIQSATEYPLQEAKAYWLYCLGVRDE
jgi:hypothetical protein